MTTHYDVVHPETFGLLGSVSLTADPTDPAAVDALVKRLTDACVGHPYWPHRLLYDAITTVEALREREAWLNEQLNNHESMLAKSRAREEQTSRRREKPMTKHYDVIHPQTGGRVGSIELKHPGWFFISNVTSHQGSRVGRDTAAKAFPPWAKKMGCVMVARD